MADQNINEEDLQPLLARHAARAKYPLGCPVWHGVTTSSKQMDARQAMVKAVYIHLETGGRVYKLKGIDGSSSQERSEQMVWEHQLAYAMDCPVKVKRMAENDPKAELDGTIVCPKPGKDGVGFSYSVRFFLGGNRVRLKLGVDDENIAFRKEERIESPSPSNLSHKNREQEMPPGPRTGKEVRSDSIGLPHFELSSLAQNPTITKSSAVPEPSAEVNDINDCSAPNQDNRDSSAKPNQVLLQRLGQLNGMNLPLLPIEMPKVKPPTTFGPCPHPLPPTSVTPPGLSKALVSKRKREPSFDGSDISPKSHQCSSVEHPKKMSKFGESGKRPARPTERGKGASRSTAEEAGDKESSRTSASSKSPPDECKIGGPRWGSDGGSAISRGGGNFGSPHRSDATSMLIRVPLWLQRDRKCQENLFFHLIGSRTSKQKGKRTVNDIGRDTNCIIRVNFDSRAARSADNRPISPPITITACACHGKSAQTDLGNAHQKIQDLLLDYIGDDGSRARLIYEVGLSRPGDHRPEDSACNAVRASDPFEEESRCRFITILPLPFHPERGKKWGKNFHAAHLLRSESQRRLRIEAGGLIKVVDSDFGVPVSLCEPYLLVMGSSVGGIDRAVEILREINEEHMRSCFCRFMRQNPCISISRK